MAFDEKQGVYNYYKLSHGRWEFFGNSADIVRGKDVECALCHTSGGVVMKELDTPWLNWEGFEDVPGASDIVDKHSEDLGSKLTGARMEVLANSGNRKWNETRIKVLEAQGDVAELLRPMFCTVQVNLDNGTDFKGMSMDAVPLDHLLDPTFRSFGGIPVKGEHYEALAREFGQFMSADSGESGLQDDDGEMIRDGAFKFTFIERSKIDHNYVGDLKSAGLVDDDFVKDVLMVDFTRPIYSSDRCKLLDFAPVDLPQPWTAESIREGFLKNLDGIEDGSFAAIFHKNLKNSEDGSAHDEDISAFLKACGERDQKDFLADAMLVAAQRRDITRSLPVFEFSETMPFSEFSVDDDQRLHPVTCVLGDFGAEAFADGADQEAQDDKPDENDNEDGE